MFIEEKEDKRLKSTIGEPGKYEVKEAKTNSPPY